MNQKTWPNRSDGSRFTAFTFSNTSGTKREWDKLHHHQQQLLSTKYRTKIPNRTTTTASSSTRHIRVRQTSSSSSLDHHRDFSSLPYDVLMKIAASFTHPNLQSASLVCRSWRDALKPLREGMLFLSWGKRFKHGHGGVRRNLDKALDSFLKGAARGCALAMVDAGLMYWEMGKKDAAIDFYLKAASLGVAQAECNLGISYLQADPPNPEEAVKWLYQASDSEDVRAQYQLALCLHHGRGVNCNLREAARWYLKAAEGGYVRAMYNISLCYSFGEGLLPSHQQAKKWMKRAADRGHSKAQYEHGLALFSEREMMKAAVYLELAYRAGETAAAHVKDVIFQLMSEATRARVMLLADKWRALPSSH